jgi:hypothetical protein
MKKTYATPAESASPSVQAMILMATSTNSLSVLATSRAVQPSF